MKVVSLGLWGTDPKYVTGAVRNAELATLIYPGWRCRFYCGTSVPADARARLASFPHVDVVAMPHPGDWTSMFWRFHAAAAADVEVAIFRDADSRLNERERAAVDAWLASRRDVHVMRDHPDHFAPILGGMWGVRAGLLPDIVGLIERYPRGNHWQIDQEFLRDIIAPRVRDRWLEHDDYYARRPFPTRRRGRGFVGQQFDEHDRPLQVGPTDLERRARQVAGVIRRAILRPRS